MYYKLIMNMDKINKKPKRTFIPQSIGDTVKKINSILRPKKRYSTIKYFLFETRTPQSFFVTVVLSYKMLWRDKYFSNSVYTA